MQLCHTPAALSAVFDEPNLIACAGLVPAIALADRIGLRDLADEWLTVPGSQGTSGVKVMSLVAGMLAGADSIDDMDLLRHGGMDKVFDDVRAPSTLGTFLRGFTFGHVRQLDAVAARALIGLADVVPGILAGSDGVVMLDIDDTVKPVFGAAKQGAQHGYTRVKGLNAQLATLSTEQAAPVIVAARLRRGAAASAHGAVRLVRDSLTTAQRAGVTGQILVRADSAYYQHAFVTAVIKAGACFSVGARQDSAVRRAIASIDDRSWVRIEYPQAVLDPDTGELVSCAEAAEVPYLAFTSHGSKAVPGRLIVRRVPERNTKKLADAAQEGLFPVWRYHAIFTNNPAPLVVAESQHRITHVTLLVIFSVWAGRTVSLAEFLPGPWVIIAVVGVLLGVIGVLVFVPKLRAFIAEKVRPEAVKVRANLRALLERPLRLVLIVAGSALLSLSYIGALDASLRAFDAQIALPIVAVIYLAGASIASAAPTPGGVGAVEAALIGGLTAAGVPSEIAIPGVFLYRLATFWIPVLPGWGAFSWLQRREYV